MRRSFVLLAVIALVVAMTAVLYAMGRVPICACGYVKLWHGVTVSSENSQHLFDPYTFTHIVHGIGFYALLWFFARRLPVATRLLLAVGLEAGWEVLENSPLIIDRYRTATISLDYYGDSIVNSVGDVFSMMLGFAIAARAPIWATAAVLVAIECLLGYFIRDNLTLNIIMLIHPIEAIKAWQAG